jgi:protein tyrosine phosphatase (PTP) superfamily phosphohydrolase (DUF442 family)
MFRTLHGTQVLPALLLAMTICAGQEPQLKGGGSASRRAHAFGQHRNIKGIGNFGEVTPNLFRGGQPSQQGFEALAKMGIAIVVDAVGNRADSEGKQVGKLGMRYVAIPWHCPFPHDDVLVQFLKLLQENPSKRVFVHCRLGDDRTGMMIAAYRMAAQEWTADEAMREMQQFGFSSIHHLICPGLASYEKSFPQHLQNNPAFEGVFSSNKHGAK